MPYAWPPEFSRDAPQRILGLSRIPDLLAEFRVAPAEVLAGLPVGEDVFREEAPQLPFSWGARILGNCAAACGCPHFGLLLGERLDHRVLGPVGEWIRNAPDLGAALSGFVEIQPAYSRGAATYLRDLGQEVVFGYGICDRGATAHRVVYDLAMAVGVKVLRRLTRGAAEPVEVLLPVQRPKDVQPYAAVLKAPLRFDQPECGIVLARSALRLPLATANAARFAQMRHAVLAELALSPQSRSQRLRHLIRPMMLDGTVSRAQIAARMDLNARTLSRYLKAEGTTFQDELEQARFAVARELLAITGLSVGDISATLRYANPPAFVAAFRRWSGMTPSAWRQAERA